MNHIRKSSVTYEVGVFREGGTEQAAVRGYTHVFADAASRKASQMKDLTEEESQELSVKSQLVARIVNLCNRISNTHCRAAATVCNNTPHASIPALCYPSNGFYP